MHIVTWNEVECDRLKTLLAEFSENFKIVSLINTEKSTVLFVLDFLNFFFLAFINWVEFAVVIFCAFVVGQDFLKVLSIVLTMNADNPFNIAAVVPADWI